MTGPTDTSDKQIEAVCKSLNHMARNDGTLSDHERGQVAATAQALLCALRDERDGLKVRVTELEDWA